MTGIIFSCFSISTVFKMRYARKFHVFLIILRSSVPLLEDLLISMQYNTEVELTENSQSLTDFFNSDGKSEGRPSF